LNSLEAQFFQSVWLAEKCCVTSQSAHSQHLNERHSWKENAAFRNNFVVIDHQAHSRNQKCSSAKQTEKLSHSAFLPDAGTCDQKSVQQVLCSLTVGGRRMNVHGQSLALS